MEERKPTTDEQYAEFVMSFVDHSDQMRDEYMERMIESMKNYLVQPEYAGRVSDKDYPLGVGLGYGSPPSPRRLSGFSVLKDSESHQIVETLLGSLVLNILSEPGYIQTRRIGVEDTFNASTSSRLLEYALRLENHYRSVYQWLKDMLIFGTGVVQADWQYREVNNALHREVRMMAGIEVPEEWRATKVLFNDPCVENVDLMDFYPSPGVPDLGRMVGCAKRFTMTAMALRRRAERPGWNREAVERAIRAGGATSADDDKNMVALEGFDRPQRRREHPDFKTSTGFEYWGEVPWRVARDEDPWKVITVVNGITVAERDWPLLNRRLPFYSATMNPMPNRFYGLSPLETSRFTQDFLDTMLSCLADATVKQTHPPWLVQRQAEIRLSKLQAYHPNIPIETDIPDGARLLDYNPNLQAGAAIMEQQKQSMRQRSGATDVEQGLGFGTKRLSASEASIQAQRSGIRPEALAMMLERNDLPPLGKAIHSLYQQYLLDSGELHDRIGSSPPSYLSEIMGEHDIHFVGSRMQHDNRTKLEALERAATVYAQLPVAQLFPWGEFMIRHLRALDLNELEAFVADPEQMALHSQLMQQGQGPGAPAANGNGAMQSNPPSGLMPAQVSGGAIG